MNEKIKDYPKTDLFEVADTLGVPHPFTIGPQHVTIAADNFNGQLSKEAIEYIERTGRPSCKHPGCNLLYGKHEQALAVKCKSKDNDLLKSYLMSIKDRCEADGFAGFVLVDCTNEG